LELIEVDWAGKKFSFNKKDFGQIERVHVRGFILICVQVETLNPWPRSNRSDDVWLFG
jgi:hypothetical protein